MLEESLNLDLDGLKSFCEDLSPNLNKGDILCLSGELGSGKTTFARNLINSIFKTNKLQKPLSIKRNQHVKLNLNLYGHANPK